MERSSHSHDSSIAICRGISSWPRYPLTLQFLVERALRGIRIDSFLIRHLRNYTSYRMQRIVQAGLVKVDDAPVTIEHRVRSGQQVAVRLTEPPDKLLEPEFGRLDILFEDPWIVVVNKPPGLTAHPAARTQRRTLVNYLQAHLDCQSPLPGLLRPGIVHRLDRETSGVIVTTKHHLAHTSLGEQFEKKRVSKAYLALVEGEHDRGAIDFPIGRVGAGGSILMSCKADARNAKPARTSYEVIARLGGYALVRAVPLTGRQHQIRIHLAEMGHPVVGDEFYDRQGGIKFAQNEARPAAVDRHKDARLAALTRHALHAERLAFTHPVSCDWVEFTAPLPADMRAAITALSDNALE